MRQLKTSNLITTWIANYTLLFKFIFSFNKKKALKIRKNIRMQDFAILTHFCKLTALENNVYLYEFV